MIKSRPKEISRCYWSENLMKREIKLLFVLILLACLLVSTWFVLRPVPLEGKKIITVRVVHLNGEEKEFRIGTDALYLRRALEDEGLIAGVESSYGMWVQTVDGETADEDLQQWWGYDVNGEYAVNGVDSQTVSDGDVYVFTLNTGY